MNICFGEILWNKNQTHTMLEVKEQNLWDAAKAILEEIYSYINAYIKK